MLINHFFSHAKKNVSFLLCCFAIIKRCWGWSFCSVAVVDFTFVSCIIHSVSSTEHVLLLTGLNTKSTYVMIKKGWIFQHGKNCCVCTFLYIFVSIYIYLRVRVCVLFIWIYICMYVHKYITHTLIENKNLPATGPCLLCVSPTVKQT